MTAGAARTSDPGPSPAAIPIGARLLACWPALIAIAGFLAAEGFIALRALRLTHGAWTYPLDDTYIHMSIARSFALHGVWGVTPDAFTSSTSSPLWTLLLAGAFALFGVRLLIPFALNLALGVGVIVVLQSMLRSAGLSRRATLVVLLAVVLGTPMPALAFTGMEHMLHIFVTLLVLRAGLRLLGGSSTRGASVALVAGSLVLTMVRYEGLFLIFALALLLALRGRWRIAAAPAIAGGLPVVAYGAISRAHGWYWLPNSVLLKGKTLHGPLRAWVKGLLNNGINQIWANPHVLVLLIAALALLLVPRRTAPGFAGYPGRENRDALVLFVVIALIHMQFAASGWFYRYEAYLVCLGLTLVGAGICLERERLRALWSRPWLPRALPALVLLVLLGRPLADRAVRSIQEAPRAAANIAEQQVQMARFFHRFYRGSTVAVNDIGAVAFLGDVHLLDVWGLASLEPARLILTRRWNLAASERLPREAGARVAIVYEDTFRQRGGLPAGWTALATWRIQHNVVCATDSVTVFALEAGETESLARHLREFDSELPPTVIRSYRPASP